MNEKFAVLGEKWGRNVKFCFRDPALLDVLIVKIGAGVLAVGCRKYQKKLAESLDAHFRIFGGRSGVIVS